MSKRTIALIGDPVASSVSPAMQRAAFAATRLDLDYVALRVTRDDLAGTLPSLRRTCLGLNVTIPLKEAILPHLDSLGPAAARAGSANTVVFADGSARGESTDGEGFLRALRRAGVTPRRALILGTGGAARAVAAALSEGGTEVTVSGRSAEAGARLARDLSVAFVSEAERADAVARADLLVNATPAGAGDGGLPIAEPLLHGGLTVFDLVYRPRRTPLLERASALGCGTVEGIEMLIEQGACSFALWTGTAAPVEVMRGAAYAALEGPCSAS